MSVVLEGILMLVVLECKKGMIFISFYFFFSSVFRTVGLKCSAIYLMFRNILISVVKL